MFANANFVEELCDREERQKSMEEEFLTKISALKQRCEDTIKQRQERASAEAKFSPCMFARGLRIDLCGRTERKEHAKQKEVLEKKLGGSEAEIRSLRLLVKDVDMHLEQ